MKNENDRKIERGISGKELRTSRNVNGIGCFEHIEKFFSNGDYFLQGQEIDDGIVGNWYVENEKLCIVQRGKLSITGTCRNIAFSNNGQIATMNSSKYSPGFRSVCIYSIRKIGGL